MEPGPIRLEIVESVDSTSEALKRRAVTDHREAALLARRQTAGRGRLGRIWHSLDGNLHLSILLRPGVLPMPGHWSLLAAVALAETIRRHAPALPGLRLKWPNDVMLADAKLAGILLEAGADTSPWLVIGIGVNLAVAPEGLEHHPTELSSNLPRLGNALVRQTTCLAAHGPAPSPEPFALSMLQSLADWRQRYRSEGFAPIRSAWLAMGPPLGTPLTITGEPRHGRFAGLGPEGALLLQTPAGRVGIVSGEVA